MPPSPALAAAVDMQVLASTPEAGCGSVSPPATSRWDDAACRRPARRRRRVLAGGGAGGQILINDVVRLLAGEQRVERFELTGPLEPEGLSGTTRAYGVQWAPPASADADRARPAPAPAALAACTGRPSLRRTLGGVGIARASRGSSPQFRRPDRAHRGRGGIGQDAAGGRVLPASSTATVPPCSSAAATTTSPSRTNRGCRSSRSCSRPARFQERAASWRSGSRRWARCSPMATLEHDRLWQPLDPESARYRLYEAFAGALREAAARWPTVVVLEDLHWAGAQTLALLRHLARSGLPAGLLVVGTFRDTSDELTEPLAACLADLRRVEPPSPASAWRASTSDAIERFVSEAIGHPLDAELQGPCGRAGARSGGNAFYLVELWRHLVASGAVALADGRWRHRGSGDQRRSCPTASARSSPPASPSCRRRRGRRSRSPPSPGSAIDLDVLAMALDVPADELDVPLGELVAAGLLSSVAIDRPGVRVRARARARHRRGGGGRRSGAGAPTSRVAQAIEKAHAADRRPVLAELARHFAAAVPARLGRQGRRLRPAGRGAGGPLGSVRRGGLPPRHGARARCARTSSGRRRSSSWRTCGCGLG